MPAAATRSCRPTRTATKPPQNTPTAAPIRLAASAAEAACTCVPYWDTIAAMPKVCMPTKATPSITK